VSPSLFDTKTIDTSKKIQEILDKMAVNVSFYNSRYFNMHCKLLQTIDKLAGKFITESYTS
jgi:hypothetical protein